MSKYGLFANKGVQETAKSNLVCLCQSISKVYILYSEKARKGSDHFGWFWGSWQFFRFLMR